MALLLAFVIVVAAAMSGSSSQPSAQATAEIPPYLLRAYIDAAATCPGLPWEVLAAIGFTESRHADGRADPVTGEVSPPIVGPALDGTNGNARIPDPSEPDGWAHAHGNMQFLKTTWARWGVVAPGRPVGAVPDYDNAYDSIYSAAHLLCGDAGRIDDLNAAILRYNPSTSYVNTVLAKAAEYRAAGAPGLLGGPIVAGAYTLPVDRSVFDAHPEYLTNPHHDYPASDIPVPTGTPVYAVTSGQVIRDRADRFQVRQRSHPRRQRRLPLPLLPRQPSARERRTSGHGWSDHHAVGRDRRRHRPASSLPDQYDRRRTNVPATAPRRVVPGHPGRATDNVERMLLLARAATQFDRTRGHDLASCRHAPV